MSSMVCVGSDWIGSYVYKMLYLCIWFNELTQSIHYHVIWAWPPYMIFEFRENRFIQPNLSIVGNKNFTIWLREYDWINTICIYAANDWKINRYKTYIRFHLRHSKIHKSTAFLQGWKITIIIIHILISIKCARRKTNMEKWEFPSHAWRERFLYHGTREKLLRFDKMKPCMLIASR